jgi:hypothetical protein
MVWPVDGEVINLSDLLENDRYIDVKYLDHSGQGLDPDQACKYGNVRDKH